MEGILAYPYFVDERVEIGIDVLSPPSPDHVQQAKNGFVVQRHDQPTVVLEGIAAPRDEQCSILKCPAAEKATPSPVYGEAAGELIELRISNLGSVVFALDRHESTGQFTNVVEAMKYPIPRAILH